MSVGNVTGLFIKRAAGVCNKRIETIFGEFVHLKRMKEFKLFFVNGWLEICGYRHDVPALQKEEGQLSQRDRATL